MSHIKGKLSKGIQKSKDAVTGTPAVKVKFREATSNEEWGPTGQQLQELARCSFHYHHFAIIMPALWKRLNANGKKWRHIYKALLVLDYLIKNGSKQVVQDARSHLPNIQTLTTFQHIDSDDKDVGQSVRERSRAIIELLNDPERLVQEREKAKQTRGKYSDAMGSNSAGSSPSYAKRPVDSDSDYDFESDFKRKSDVYAVQHAREGMNSPRGRDSEYPIPEALPREWITESQERQLRSQKSGGAREEAYQPSKSAVKSPKPTPPDLQEKADQLKEMFPSLTNEAAIKVLCKCQYSISEAALQLSDPRVINKYTSTSSGQNVGRVSTGDNLLEEKILNDGQSSLTYSSAMAPVKVHQQQPPVQQFQQTPLTFASQPAVTTFTVPRQQQPLSSPPPGATQGWTTFGSQTSGPYGSTNSMLPFSSSSIPTQQSQLASPYFSLQQPPLSAGSAMPIQAQLGSQQKPGFTAQTPFTSGNQTPFTSGNQTPFTSGNQTPFTSGNQTQFTSGNQTQFTSGTQSQTLPTYPTFGQISQPQVLMSACRSPIASSQLPQAYPQQTLQRQTNQSQAADETFASLVIQQLPKGVHLRSLSPGEEQPEPKKTLAQLQLSSNPSQQQQDLFF